MCSNCKIALIASTPTDRTPTGGVVFDETRREVWAERRSVTRAEFYAAHQAGIKPTATFAVGPGVYRDEQYVEYQQVRYRVVRSFSKSVTETELTCAED